MRRAIYAAVIVSILGATLWVLRHRHDKKVDKAIAAPTLGTNDRLKYVIDSRHHTITTVRRNGTNGETVTRTFLNAHGPVAITEKKDGSVSLAQRTWGTIHEPFFGAAFGTDVKFRAAIGVDLFYIQRFELGGGLLLTPTDVKDVRVFAHVAYNVYDNLLISAGVDNHKAVHLIASVRF